MVVRENGPIENSQVGLLLLSFLVFVFKSFVVERRARFFLWMGAWLCLSFVFRELDVENLPVQDWVVWMCDGMGRSLILVSGWAVLGVIAIKTYSEWRGMMPNMLRSWSAVFTFSGGLFLIFSGLYDRELILVEQSRLWEESFEAVGYFLLLAAAILFKSNLQSGSTVVES